MQITEEQVLRVQFPDAWEFGNSILYRLCKENPLHTDAGVVVGKIWLIGRSYAAAIERRKTKEETQGDDFYFDIVAPTVIKYGEELDKRIHCLKKFERLDSDILKEIVSLHKFLVDVFHIVSGDNKRSLASKYLYFHLPNIFYIYDDRAERASSRLVKAKKADMIRRLKDTRYDEVYVGFLSRIIQIDNFIKSEYGVELTPRQLDALLLNY